MWGWSPAPACRSSGHDVVCIDKDEAKVADLRAGSIPIFEPGLDEVVAANVCAPGASPSPPAWRRRWPQAEAVFIAGRHAQPPRRRPCRSHLCLRRRRGIGRRIWAPIPSSSPNRPCRSATSRKVKEIIARARPGAAFDVCSNPRIPARGSAIEDFPPARPRRRRLRQRPRPRRDPARSTSPPLPARGRRSCSPARKAPSSSKYAGERVPRDQDHLHQRDGRSLRKSGRRHPGRGARHRARRTHRFQIPARGPRLRRLMLPEGHPRPAQEPRRTAARRRASSKPSSTSTRRARSRWPRRSRARSAASRARPSPCSASPSSPTRRHARCAQPRHRAASGGSRRHDPRLRSRRRQGSPQAARHRTAQKRYEALEGADGVG